MTRGDIITQALRVVGDTSLTTEAADWVDNVLLEIDSVGFWRFLSKETTLQTQHTVWGINFSDPKWPAAALTDYSKGMSIWSDEPRGLTRISKAAFDKGYDASTGNPEFFALWQDAVYLWPTPVTGSLPLLTVQYYQEITLPTADADDIETVVGIKPKWQGFLIDGVIAEGFSYMEDPRRDNYMQIWQRHLGMMLKDNEDFSTPVEAQWDKPSVDVRKRVAVDGGR